MAYTTSLATLLVDRAAHLLRLIDRALLDGVIDATEAPAIRAEAAIVHGGARVVDLTQREAASWLRCRRFGRDLATDARDLDLPPAA